MARGLVYRPQVSPLRAIVEVTGTKEIYTPRVLSVFQTVRCAKKAQRSALTGHSLDVPDTAAVCEERPVLADAQRVRYVPDKQSPVSVDAHHLRSGGAKPAPQRRGIPNHRPVSTAGVAVAALHLAERAFVDGSDVDTVIFLGRSIRCATKPTSEGIFGHGARALANTVAAGSAGATGNASLRCRSRQVGDLLELLHGGDVGVAQRGRARQGGDVAEAVGLEQSDNPVGAGHSQRAVLVYRQAVGSGRLQGDPMLHHTTPCVVGEGRGGVRGQMRVEASGETASTSHCSVSGIAGSIPLRLSGGLQETIGISPRTLDNEYIVSEAHIIKKISLLTSSASFLPEPVTLSCFSV